MCTGQPEIDYRLEHAREGLDAIAKYVDRLLKTDSHVDITGNQMVTISQYDLNWIRSAAIVTLKTSR